MQTTLVILKPDTIERGLIWKVISRIEDKGLTIAWMKMMQLSDSIIAEHYAHLKDKPFFPDIQNFMKKTPVIVIAIRWKDAIKTLRTLTWATNPAEALPWTIRGDFALTVDGNIIHASDSEESAENELKRFFGEEWVFHYEKLVEEMI